MSQTSLLSAAHRHLDLAREASSGRSAETLCGGRDHALRQVLVALTGGRQLDEHENPGDATLQVLHGCVMLTAGGSSWTLGSGDLAVIPDGRHALLAEEDSVVLLTMTSR